MFSILDDSPIEPPIQVDSRWVNMDKVEQEKLAWMKDLPVPSAGHAGVINSNLSVFKEKKWC